MIKTNLDARTILQVNATIIAGVLILLTISDFSGTHKLYSIHYGLTIGQWILGIIIPFSVASFGLVVGFLATILNNTNSTQTEYGRKASFLILMSMMVGFAYLIIVAVILSDVRKG